VRFNARLKQIKVFVAVATTELTAFSIVADATRFVSSANRALKRTAKFNESLTRHKYKNFDYKALVLCN